MHNKKKLTILLFVIVMVNCSMVNRSINNALFPPPYEISHFDINLQNEYSFTIKIDFKTESIDKNWRSDESQPYKVVIQSKSLQSTDSKANDNWHKIDSVYKETKQQFQGELILEWNGKINDKVKLILNKDTGTSIVNQTIPIGTFWMQKTDDKFITEVKVTVSKTDPFLSKLLENPEIAIYRPNAHK